MKVALAKWGNSTSVRIPSAYLSALNLKAADTVDMRLEDGRLVIEPAIAEDEADLEDLLSRLTPDVIQTEADFGPPQGNEAL